jgi:Mn2+/Fe2+ NRAMP family transporter
MIEVDQERTGLKVFFTTPPLSLVKRYGSFSGGGSSSPALGILMLGVDPTFALVISQVVLSFGIPFALVPLIWLTSRRTVLGEFSNRPITSVLGIIAAVLIACLNGVLLVLIFTGN